MNTKEFLSAPLKFSSDMAAARIKPKPKVDYEKQLQDEFLMIVAGIELGEANRKRKIDKRDKLKKKIKRILKRIDDEK